MMSYMCDSGESCEFDRRSTAPSLASGFVFRTAEERVRYEFALDMSCE